MLILGIETSCDETAAAVVRDGREVLSNVIYSQIARHEKYGGVVPEIASRAHVEKLPGIIAEAIREAGVNWTDLDAIAATRGPGLATCLLVGFTAAKALAQRLNKPLLGINHLEGHAYSIFLTSDLRPLTSDHHPVLTLIASGGHTSLVLNRAPGQFTILGETFDDAAGEALDKGAKLLGLGYPGGPAIETAARDGNPAAINFPRGMKARTADPALRYAFSFSGLKTSLLYHLKKVGVPPLGGIGSSLPDLAASYQEAVVDTLLQKIERALDDHQVRALGCAGGVARNKRLREKLEQLAAQHNLPLLLAPPDYCTDNAAMIAAVASAEPDLTRHLATNLDIDPTWPLAAPDHQTIRQSDHRN